MARRLSVYCEPIDQQLNVVLELIIWHRSQNHSEIGHAVEDTGSPISNISRAKTGPPTSMILFARTRSVPADLGPATFQSGPCVPQQRDHNATPAHCRQRSHHHVRRQQGNGYIATECNISSMALALPACHWCRVPSDPHRHKMMGQRRAAPSTARLPEFPMNNCWSSASIGTFRALRFSGRLSVTVRTAPSAAFSTRTKVSVIERSY